MRPQVPGVASSGVRVWLLCALSFSPRRKEKQKKEKEKGMEKEKMEEKVLKTCQAASSAGPV